MKISQVGCIDDEAPLLTSILCKIPAQLVIWREESMKALLFFVFIGYGGCFSAWGKNRGL